VTKMVKKIYTEAMSLSESERVELAARLLDPFDPSQADDDYVHAWEAEIESRLRELDAKEAKTVPWSKAKAMIQRRGKRDGKAR
jgi:putative addiction module component (TIGR02574 family)